MYIFKLIFKYVCNIYCYVYKRRKRYNFSYFVKSKNEFLNCERRNMTNLHCKWNLFIDYKCKQLKFPFTTTVICTMFSITQWVYLWNTTMPCEFNDFTIMLIFHTRMLSLSEFMFSSIKLLTASTWLLQTMIYNSFVLIYNYFQLHSLFCNKGKNTTYLEKHFIYVLNNFGSLH